MMIKKFIMGTLWETLNLVLRQNGFPNGFTELCRKYRVLKLLIAK